MRFRLKKAAHLPVGWDVKQLLVLVRDKKRWPLPDFFDMDPPKKVVIIPIIVVIYGLYDGINYHLVGGAMCPS